MGTNPLQKYCRQPKIFVSLPTAGMYNKVGTLTGDVTHMPIYSMTGMDEIVIKTPDALLSGESTVSIIESCCSTIKDGWEVTSLDVDLLLTAIRIATYGNVLEVIQVCPNCGQENDYDIDLGTVVDHFAQCKYNNTVAYDDLIIKLQPLTYRQSTEFSMRNFRLQQQLSAAASESEENQKRIIADLFKQLGVMQNDIYSASIDSVDTGSVVVTERRYIQEWLENCDRNVFEKIKETFDANKEAWKIPEVGVKCTACDHDSTVSIELDQSNFFAAA